MHKRKIRRTPYRLRSKRTVRPTLRSIVAIYTVAIAQYVMAFGLVMTRDAQGRIVPNPNPPLHLVMFLIGSGSFAAGVRVPFKELSDLTIAIKK